MTRSADDEIRIIAEAVQWLRRLEEQPGEETADRFIEWIRASPQHVETLLIQSEIEAAIRRYQAMHSSRLADALPSAGASRDPDIAAAAGKSAMPRILWTFAVALLLLALVWASHAARPEVRRSEASPIVANFSGGSRADLYPDTELSYRSIAGFTRITVDRGGGRFHVRHSPWQRFQVHAGGVLITSTGTAFNVFRTIERTGVYVSEGSVRLEGRFHAITLREGQSTYVSADGLIGTVYASAAKRRWINANLSAIAEEINRRSQTPQIVVKGRVRDLRFSGYVGLDKPEAWIAALRTYPDVEIERHRNEVIIRHRIK